MTARKLTGEEIDAILRDRRARAEAAMRGRAHRALPLDLVEARKQADLVAQADQRAAATIQKRFPNCNGSCEAGRSQCNCPTAGASACSDLLADPPKRTPPPVPWRELAGGLLVLLFAVSCVHVIATATKPAEKVAKR